MATPASSYFCRSSLTLLSGAETRHLRSDVERGLPGGLLLRCGIAAASGRGLDEIGGDAEEAFDRLRSKLDGAHAELHALLQRLIPAQGVAAEAVRNVEPDLDAGDLRAWLLKQAGARQRDKRELAQFTSRIQDALAFAG